MDERRRETQKTDRVVVIKDNVATKTGIVAKKRTMLQQKTDKVADENGQYCNEMVSIAVEYGLCCYGKLAMIW